MELPTDFLRHSTRHSTSKFRKLATGHHSKIARSLTERIHFASLSHKTSQLKRFSSKDTNSTSETFAVAAWTDMCETFVVTTSNIHHQDIHLGHLAMYLQRRDNNTGQISMYLLTFATYPSPYVPPGLTLKNSTCAHNAFTNVFCTDFRTGSNFCLMQH